ncbi:hypothetical protein [Myxococcus qinghaiensis]|uniref:hypothetical protein n=1 Tax=Myxococcus qinghaiensis TaxID=2906758 RepID=UPI0020A83306|nr:hypothetical protein [Myxococcus qinghaiensis]MCP3165989.1 hypothetical protein [Myxococcus qinghaiensis]
MTTWTAHAFARGLAALRQFAQAEPEATRLARADFPKHWDPIRFPWMETSLLAWTLHGREDAEGHTAADRQLLTAGTHLSRAERSILQALAASWCSIFEVQDVQLGKSLRLRDLLLDEVLEFREQSLTFQVVPGDVFVTWAMPAGDHLELTGGTVVIAESQHPLLLDSVRRELGTLPPLEDLAGRRRQVRRRGPFLFRRVMELISEEAPSFDEEEAMAFAESLLPPRRRAFQDFAGQRPRKRRSASKGELEEGSAYVFKLGPIDTAQDGGVSFYMAVEAGGFVLPPECVKRDVDGLAALARVLKGRKVYCESRLSRAGAAFGFVSRPTPPSIVSLRAHLAVQSYWIPRKAQRVPPDDMEAFLLATAALIREAPWETWTNGELFTVTLEGSVKGTRELSVMGNGGAEFGFSLFDRMGSADRVARSSTAVPGVDMLIPDTLGLTLDDTPAWASKAIQQHTGVPFVPDLLRVRRNKLLPGDVEDVRVSTAIALALAEARPEDATTEVELRLGDFHLRVKLEVPLPLLTGFYVGKLDLASLPLHPPKASGKASRKLPQRKVSETLLDFARPLLEDIESSERPQEELFTVLALALSAWNAVVQDTWEPEKGWVERARATLRRMPRENGELMEKDFELLVERKKQRDFADDPRLLTGLDVVIRHKGELGVQLIGVVTPGAWKEFFGA